MLLCMIKRLCHGSETALQCVGCPPPISHLILTFCGFLAQTSSVSGQLVECLFWRRVYLIDFNKCFVKVLPVKFIFFFLHIGLHNINLHLKVLARNGL